MAVQGNWNYVDPNGVWHNLTLEKSKVSIDGGAPFRINKYRAPGGNMVESVFQIPNEHNCDLKINIRAGKAILTHNGIDVQTGRTYTPPKMPGWIWVFYVLFIAEFFLIVGGAVGGGIFGSAAFICSGLAVNDKMKTSTKILACIGVLIGFTAIGILVAVLVQGAIGWLW